MVRIRLELVNGGLLNRVNARTLSSWAAMDRLFRKCFYLHYNPGQLNTLIITDAYLRTLKLQIRGTDHRDGAVYHYYKGEAPSLKQVDPQDDQRQLFWQAFKNAPFNLTIQQVGPLPYWANVA